MNKTLFKFLVISIVSLIFLYGYSGSYSSTNIDNISYVTALGIDLSDDKQNLKVTFEFMDAAPFAGNNSGEVSPPALDTITAKTISNAINILNAYIGKEVNMSHCKVVIFSENVAKKGLISEVTELMNNIQIRPSTNIIISRSDSSDYIENTTSSLEKVLTKYYEIFPNSSKYTGYTSDITIGDFYANLIDNDCGNVAILGGVNPESKANGQGSGSESQPGGQSSGSGVQDSGGSSQSGSQDSSSESSNSEKTDDKKSSLQNVSVSNMIAGGAPISGERATENIGLAVFNNSSYIGNLTALETLCHCLIANEVNSFVLTIADTKFYEKYINLNLFQSENADINVDVSGDTPIININVSLNGRVLGFKDDSLPPNYIDVDKLSTATGKYLTKIMEDYLDKTKSDFGCDIDYFYRYGKSNFLTMSDWNSFNWKEKYKKAKFNVNFDTVVYYSLLDSNN